MSSPYSVSEIPHPLSCRILMVEDSPIDAEQIRRVLHSQSAFLIDHVPTLSETRICLERERYDAVLLDLSLPDGDYQATLSELAPFAEHVPIIAVTGHEDDELARACLGAGIQEYFHKSDLMDSSLVRCVTHAISRHRAAEIQRRLELARREISLGRVAGGVVHELNNLATVVLSNLEYGRERIRELRAQVKLELQPALAELIESFDEDISAMGRMASVAGELQLFTRREGAESSLCDLAVVVKRALRLLEGRLRLRARVDCALGDVPTVQADEAGLSQVLINLLLNAADALDEVVGRDRRIYVETRFEAPWALLEIADSGCGIEPEDLEQVFQPYFTSKPIGRGSGLGLAICVDLVEGYGGTISAKSEVGRGTRFTVSLPVVSERPNGEPERVTADSERGPRGRVLLIDDLEAPRRALRRLIQRQHEVVEAAGPLEALRILGEGNRFDVVLCDLMMPEMDGLEVLKRASESDPSLRDRFVFLTGGAYTDESRAALTRTGLPVLAKPITGADLLEAIERIRGGPRPN